MAENNPVSILIQNTELFFRLSKDEINYVVSRSCTLNLPKGKLLFSSGEKAKHFYILINGTVRVFNPHDGVEDELAMFTEGDTIGDFDFARGAEYDACAEAVEDSQLIMFPGDSHTIESLSPENPNTVCSIMLNAIIMMTGRIKSTRKLILQNMSWVQELHRRAYEDAGTGLWKQALITDEIVGHLENPSALIMLKPDRFKILVDSRGHSAGDEAMIRISIILKNITRQMGHGWPMRFKSNEVGLIFYNCDAAMTQKIANELSEAVFAMEPVCSSQDAPPFDFTATISWAVWPDDDAEWESMFQGNYALLLDTWKAGGEKIIHYKKEDNNE